MKQLLIIEDDEVNCLLYEEILSSNSISIEFAYDGEEGINKFKKKPYDLVLLDLGLPKICGLEVARLIKEYEENQLPVKKTPIIIITANNFPGMQRLAFEAGADGYMTKPFDIEQLRFLVTSYLQKKEGCLF